MGTNNEELVKSNLKNIAKEIEEKLPKGFGFTLLAYQFEEGTEMLYVSNSNREDIVKAMKEWIEKTENNYGNDTGKY